MTVDDLRRQLADEYGQERFTMTVGEIERRAGRTGHRVAAWVGATAAALAVAAFLAWPQAPAGQVDPLASPSASGGASGDWFAVQCERNWSGQDRSRLRADERAELPPLRIERSEGEQGIRVYGSDQVTAVCERDGAAVSLRFARTDDPDRRWLPDFGTGVAYVWGASMAGGSAGPLSHIVGRASADAQAVVAVTADGQRIRGQFGGGYFVLWAPRGDLRGAVVETTLGPFEILVAEGSPVFGDLDDRTTDEACRANLASGFASVGPVAMPPRRFAQSDGATTLLVYGSSNTMVACSHDSGTVQLSVARVGRYAKVSAWGETQTFVSASSMAGWLIGVTPEEAIGGTVTLNSGRKIPLQVSQGWYACRWTAETDGERPVEVELDLGMTRISWPMNHVE